MSLQTLKLFLKHKFLFCIVIKYFKEYFENPAQDQEMTVVFTPQPLVIGDTERQITAQALLTAIRAQRPASAKGLFIKNCTVSTTMGVGLRVNVSRE